MAEKTGIEWTDHTFNIAWGCMKVSPGCANCYADTLSHRFGFDVWGPAKTTTRRTFGAKHWNDPLRWNRSAEKAGVRRRVFCSSMCDVFEEHPIIDAERERLWPLIRLTPWLDWLILTKRPERIAEHLPADWGSGYPNVWLGTSVESQEYAASRIPALAEIPATVRFLSIEPMLGEVSLRWLPNRKLDGHRVDREQYDSVRSIIHWVIVGGESGDGRREMPIEAFGVVCDQAKAFGAAVFVKQDSGPRSGMRGRIRDEHWALKEWPR